MNQFSSAPDVSNQNRILFGRYMLPDKSEHPCQVLEIDVNGAAFRATTPPEPGMRIVAYLDEIGRVEATVDSVEDNLFAVSFNLSALRKERFQSKLDWLESGDEAGGRESRRHTRFEPKDTKSHITLHDGRVYPCELLDISLSGAAVSTPVMPAIGTFLTLGKMRGRVVRLLENGIAIEFATQLDQRSLSEQIN